MSAVNPQSQSPDPQGSGPARQCALLIEDSGQDVWLVKRAIDASKRALHLASARNGDEAVDYLSGVGVYADRVQYPMPAVVLLDIKLPRRSGFQVLNWVRENGADIQHLPIVILSSSDEPKDIRRAYELGANGYVVKPHANGELKRSLDNVWAFWLDENRLPFPAC